MPLKAVQQQIVSVGPVCAMCGRLRVGKENLHVAGLGRCSVDFAPQRASFFGRGHLRDLHSRLSGLDGSYSDHPDAPFVWPDAGRMPMPVRSTCGEACSSRPAVAAAHSIIWAKPIAIGGELGLRSVTERAANDSFNRGPDGRNQPFIP